MKLNFLFEEAGSYEIKDLVTNFPSKRGKALQKMWGKSGVLLYKGQPLFDGGSLGAAYEGAMEAAEKLQGETISTSLYFDGSSNDVELEVDEMQEVYLGYDKKQDKLYIGYDVWMNDETIESEFDKAFEDITGDRFDADSDEHNKIYRDWKNSKDYPGFSGFLFELTSKDGKNFKADFIQDSPGGFYQGVYNGYEFKRLGLVDLRLD